MKILGIEHFRYLSTEDREMFRQAFMECGDMTGYAFAEQYVEGGYRTWKKLAKCKSMGVVQYIKEWFDTLDVKMRSEAILNIAKNKENFNANKWLADRGWAEKQDKRTKHSKQLEAEADKAVSDDMERLGFVQGVETRQ